jgi:hypothetical protein
MDELLLEIDIGIVIAIASAVISMFAVFVSFLTSREQQRLSERLAEEERAMLFEQVRMQRDSDVIRWTEACVHQLAEIEAYISMREAAVPSAESRERHLQLLARLSALIDHGRLFFPNEQPDKQGADKPAAYKGFRQKILSVLVGAYAVLQKHGDLTSPQACRDAVDQLFHLRRDFVSEAQLAIDPRRFIALKEMNEIRTSKGLAPQKLEDKDPSEAYR